MECLASRTLLPFIGITSHPSIMYFIIVWERLLQVITSQCPCSNIIACISSIIGRNMHA